jgi:hypothetical protein
LERLTRDLEEAKTAIKSLEGTFRSTAEMELVLLADAAIKDQVAVHTALREHGAKLQGFYDQRQRTEKEFARLEQEFKHLTGGPSIVFLTVSLLLHDKVGAWDGAIHEGVRISLGQVGQ